MSYQSHYTVTVLTDIQAEEDTYIDLARNEAVGLAEEKAKEVGESGRVFISKFRKGDGQTQYLNRDGFSPVGESWT